MEALDGRGGRAGEFLRWYLWNKAQESYTGHNVKELHKASPFSGRCLVFDDWVLLKPFLKLVN